MRLKGVITYLDDGSVDVVVVSGVEGAEGDTEEGEGGGGDAVHDARGDDRELARAEVRGC